MFPETFRKHFPPAGPERRRGVFCQATKGDVPVVEKVFQTKDEAVEYAIHLQRDRRNLTEDDITRLVAELDKRKDRSGDHTSAAGKAKASSDAIAQKTAAKTAEVIGTSQAKVERARTVLDHAAPEVKAAVLAGEVAFPAPWRAIGRLRRCSGPSEAAGHGGETFVRVHP